jgi:putative ABC transport system permease protein
VQSVFVFTLFAGLTVLLAAVQATRDERRYESAMLRTLGASRATVTRGILAEFTALGLLSGLLHRHSQQPHLVRLVNAKAA